MSSRKDQNQTQKQSRPILCAAALGYLMLPTRPEAIR
jgi:hypothetical protein